MDGAAGGGRRARRRSSTWCATWTPGSTSTALTVFARWITPPLTPKRFDTWFYAVNAPAEQLAACDGRETVDAEWIAPAEALRLAAAGERKVIFPTRMNLQLLAEASGRAGRGGPRGGPHPGHRAAADPAAGRRARARAAAGRRLWRGRGAAGKRHVSAVAGRKHDQSLSCAERRFAGVFDGEPKENQPMRLAILARRRRPRHGPAGHSPAAQTVVPVDRFNAVELHGGGTIMHPPGAGPARDPDQRRPGQGPFEVDSARAADPQPLPRDLLGRPTTSTSRSRRRT